MKKYLAVVFIFCISIAEGQVTFKKVYSGADLPYVSQTTDGGFLLGGNQQDANWVSSIAIMKADQFGDSVWSKFYKPAEGASFKQTPDGGIVIGGHSAGMLVIKLDSSGAVDWSKEYFGDGGTWDKILSITPTFDGGYVFSGDQFYIGPMYSDACLIKIDSTGDTLWTRTFNNPLGGSSGTNILQTRDSCFLLTMGSNSHIDILKVNINGDTLWSKEIIGTNGSVVEVIQAQDLGFAFTGHGSAGIFLLKTDSIGNPLWLKNFDAYNNGSYPYRLIHTHNQGYVISGTSVFHDSLNHPYSFIISTDQYGDTLWTRSHETPSGMGDIAITSDGGFISIGSYQGHSALIKMDSLGNSFCNEIGITSTMSTPTFQVANPQISIISPFYYTNPKILTDSSGVNVLPICFSINDAISTINNPPTEIHFSPNPTTSILKLETTQNIEHIDLFNILGEKVYVAVDYLRMAMGMLTVDCSLLPPGIYILQASGEGKVWRGKVVKE